MCIPKHKPKNAHNIPQWRDRMAAYKHDIDYWLQLQFLHGGPNLCPPFIRQQVCISRSRYRRQFRLLRREIEYNLANSTTLNNCFKRMFRHPKSPTPAYIEGYSSINQPSMWRNQFVDVFKGENSPYSCDIIEDVNPTPFDIENFNYINLDEINSTIELINTNKSYTRHKHWKFLHTENHSAKFCLLHTMNFWIKNAFQDCSYFDWDFFLSNLNVIPKQGKKDLSLKKSYRPLSIGTSENWILEKILLSRVSPFLKTHDCQFGYKQHHSTTHAIEIVRIIERDYDAHACTLDASSAFDKLS